MSSIWPSLCSGRRHSQHWWEIWLLSNVFMYAYARYSNYIPNLRKGHSQKENWFIADTHVRTYIAEGVSTFCRMLLSLLAFFRHMQTVSHNAFLTKGKAEMACSYDQICSELSNNLQWLKSIAIYVCILAVYSIYIMVIHKPPFMSLKGHQNKNKSSQTHEV